MEPDYDLLDILMTDNSAEAASDKIKEILYAKSAEKINSYKPVIAQSMFDTYQSESEE